jgi:hypothetical protein
MEGSEEVDFLERLEAIAGGLANLDRPLLARQFLRKSTRLAQNIFSQVAFLARRLLLL